MSKEDRPVRKVFERNVEVLSPVVNIAIENIRRLSLSPNTSIPENFTGSPQEILIESQKNEARAITHRRLRDMWISFFDEVTPAFIESMSIVKLFENGQVNSRNFAPETIQRWDLPDSVNSDSTTTEAEKSTDAKHEAITRIYNEILSKNIFKGKYTQRDIEHFSLIYLGTIEGISVTRQSLANALFPEIDKKAVSSDLVHDRQTAINNRVRKFGITIRSRDRDKKFRTRGESFKEYYLDFCESTTEISIPLKKSKVPTSEKEISEPEWIAVTPDELSKILFRASQYKKRRGEQMHEKVFTAFLDAHNGTVLRSQLQDIVAPTGKPEVRAAKLNTALAAARRFLNNIGLTEIKLSSSSRHLNGNKRKSRVVRLGKSK